MDLLLESDLPPELPREARALLDGADIARDRVGESPARVYRLRRRNDRLFLKLSHRRLSSTTYSVKREAGVIGWLKGRLPVPEVLLYSGNAAWECMVMRAVPGKPLSAFIGEGPRCVKVFAEAIKMLQSVPVADCPFDSRRAARLKELARLMRMGTIDRGADLSVYTGVKTPGDLFARLRAETVSEDPVFSHGDLCDSNLFLDRRGRIHFIDLGRGGVADRWLDIAFACRNLARDVSAPAARQLLSRLGLADQPERRRYFEMLDELF